MDIYIYNRMIEVLQKAYPELYRKYKNFMVVSLTKEQKKSSQYRFHLKRIELCTLSRTAGDIFISALLELARHIDVINRRETHDDYELMTIFRTLLIAAVRLNLIQVNDLKRFTNVKIRDKVQHFFHKFEYWKFEKEEPVKAAYAYIYVFEAFMIKNLLKTNGYHYDAAQNCWIKKLLSSDLKKEKKFVDAHEMEAEWKIIADNSFYIRPVYKIKLKTYSIEDSKLLRALEYQYDPHTRFWHKLIIAADVEQELKNLVEIPKQSLNITSPATKRT